MISVHFVDHLIVGLFCQFQIQNLILRIIIPKESKDLDQYFYQS